MDDRSIALLLGYDFPGNVRELENIIEYAFILCPGGLIQPEHMPEPFKPKGKDELIGIGVNEAMTIAQAEKMVIHQALERNKWRRMATCRELDISKDTLRRKISRYGIEQPDPTAG